MNATNYHMLRKFNAALARHGDPICTDKAMPLRYVSGPRVDGRVVVEDGENYLQVSQDGIRMAPLTWVENAPTYAGDTLYNSEGGSIVVGGLIHSAIYGILVTSTDGCGSVPHRQLTRNPIWQPQPELRSSGKPFPWGLPLWYVAAKRSLDDSDLRVLHNRIETLTNELRETSQLVADLRESLANVKNALNGVA